MRAPNSPSRDIETLFRSSEADLKSYVRRKLGRAGRNDVEDIVQESFLRVSTQESDESIRNPRGFLFRTARNLMIDLARKRQVRMEKADAVRAEPGERERADRVTPERQLSSEQDLELIMAAIDNLPPACRRVFLMQRQFDLAYADIAARLGISESMVQKHMSKALCHLYKVLP